MKRNLLLFVCAMGLLVWIQACNSDPDVPNPYDNQKPKIDHDRVNDSTILPAPVTIQAIQKLVFEPTCANSGCHDGTFEPDFRTVESSYNSIVNRANIKQDTSDPIAFRVQPGDPGKSMLIRRMEVDLNGNSGKMPLVTEPGSDWPDKKDEYIQMIKDWISQGALDQHGNPPPDANYPPELLGVAGYKNGSLLSRSRRHNPMEVSAGSTVDIWFAYSDDKLDVSQLTKMSAFTSKHAFDYSASTPINITYSATPKVEDGFKGDPVTFHHKITLDLSSYVSGEVIWIKTALSDGPNTLELPGLFSEFTWKSYTAIKIN